MNPEDIQKLLRLKRFERPEPAYFEKFLRDFHRQQREELLRQPLWRIAWDRFETFFGEHSMGRTAYAGAIAAVVIFAAVATINPHQRTGGDIAQNGIVSEVSSKLSLDPRASLPRLTPQLAHSVTHAAAGSPHYVIDARPVSYEPDFSF